MKVLREIQSNIAFIGLFLSLFVLFLYLEMETYEPHPSMIFRIAGALADASLIALPLLFLRGRWRYIAGVVTVGAGVLIFANALYFRNFNDLIPASLYLHNQATDSLVVDSAVQSLRLSDFIVLVFSLLPLTLMLFYKKWPTDRSDRKRMLCLVICGLGIGWGITISGSIRRYKILNTTEQATIGEILFPNASIDWISYYHKLNFTGYLSRVIPRSFTSRKTLSHDEIIQIQHYLQEKAAARLPKSDSRVNKNLVFIVVESLPSVALESKFAMSAAPVLTELIGDSTTIYVKRCKVLADLGRSSDAQFIYNTGLLPLRDDILVTDYASNDYPSIAKALEVESLEIIGEDKRMWSHASTSVSYGFSRLIDNAGRKDNASTLDLDSIIFNTASGEITEVTNPFFMFITTISMHDPYKRAAVTHKLPSGSINCNDDRDWEYLQRLHHFDTALGRFIGQLKRRGIYDNTIIVITGDHEIRESAVSDALHDNAVPLIILNSPVRGEYATEATQADVFPTILDIMGIGYSYLHVDYSGLGRSIFFRSPDASPVMPAPLDYKISEMLIRHKQPADSQ